MIGGESQLGGIEGYVAMSHAILAEQVEKSAENFLTTRMTAIRPTLLHTLPQAVYVGLQCKKEVADDLTDGSLTMQLTRYQLEILRGALPIVLFQWQVNDIVRKYLHRIVMTDTWQAGYDQHLYGIVGTDVLNFND